MTDRKRKRCEKNLIDYLISHCFPGAKRWWAKCWAKWPLVISGHLQVFDLSGALFASTWPFTGYCLTIAWPFYTSQGLSVTSPPPLYTFGNWAIFLLCRNRILSHLSGLHWSLWSELILGLCFYFWSILSLWENVWDKRANFSVLVSVDTSLSGHPLHNRISYSTGSS